MMHEYKKMENNSNLKIYHVLDMKSNIDALDSVMPTETTTE